MKGRSLDCTCCNYLSQIINTGCIPNVSTTFIVLTRTIHELSAFTVDIILFYHTLIEYPNNNKNKTAKTHGLRKILLDNHKMLDKAVLVDRLMAGWAKDRGNRGGLKTGMKPDSIYNNVHNKYCQRYYQLSADPHSNIAVCTTPTTILICSALPLQAKAHAIL